MTRNLQLQFATYKYIDPDEPYPALVSAFIPDERSKVIAINKSHFPALVRRIQRQEHVSYRKAKQIATKFVEHTIVSDLTHETAHVAEEKTGGAAVRAMNLEKKKMESPIHVGEFEKIDRRSELMAFRYSGRKKKLAKIKSKLKNF